MPVMVPRALFFQGRLVGALSGYGYETPWAVARLLPADPDLYRRLLGVCETPRALTSRARLIFGDI